MQLPLKIPIVVPIKVSGAEVSREIEVILDTGARYTMVSWDIAKDIGYDPAISERRAKLVTANGVIEAPLITVKEVSLGDFSIKNLDVVCHEIPEIVGIEGLLGLNFLENFTTKIDFKNKVLEIV